MTTSIHDCALKRYTCANDRFILLSSLLSLLRHFSFTRIANHRRSLFRLKVYVVSVVSFLTRGGFLAHWTLSNLHTHTKSRLLLCDTPISVVIPSCY